jgi:hypothetical protein
VYTPVHLAKWANYQETTVAKMRRAGSRKTKAGKSGGATEKAVAQKPHEDSVVVDRRANRDRRKSGDRRKKDVPVAVERRKIERRAKVNRRRQIDPTTCERDYTEEEVEFMNALDEYKRTSGRMFPTCSEILEVVRKLGYEKTTGGHPVHPTNQDGKTHETGGTQADAEGGSAREADSEASV